MKKRNHVLLVLCVSATVFGLTNYGGIRAPDSEVVFRVAESLATDGSFASSPS